MRRYRWFLASLATLALGGCLYAWAQGVHHHTTDVYDFFNGFQLRGGTAITGTTGTGTAAVVFPTNSVGLGTEVSGFMEVVTFCGQLPNATTGYLGPGLLGLNGTPTDYIMGGTACDALDSGTEATADAPLSTLPLKLVGMRCKQSAASGAAETTVYTARTDAADIATTDGGATTITCSINGATATECVAAGGSTTNIAASGTTAVKVVASANLSAQDAICKWVVAFP